MSLSNSSKCGLCNQQTPRYTCPQCSVNYCSSTCFKSAQHLSCSENFFKNCIKQEMELKKNRSGNMKPDINQMEQILSNLNQQDFDEQDSDDENSDSEDIEERLKDVDLNDPDEVWEKLNEDEKEKFHGLLESGKIMEYLLVDWIPWWVSAGSHKIQEMDAATDRLEFQMPSIKSDIQALTKLTSKKPSETIVYDLMNVLFGYVSATRTFRHDPFNSTPRKEFKSLISFVLSVSSALGDGKNFLSASEAVSHAEATCHNLMIPTELTAEFKKDVIYLLKHKKFSLCALSDLHQWFVQVKDGKHFSKRLILTNQKKIEFFLSYINDNP